MILRVVHGDLVAQIDHLVINRWLDIWVCESKHFSEGSPSMTTANSLHSLPASPMVSHHPIEQNEKHILILQRIFDAGTVELPKRLGFTIKPDLKSLVLVSKGARISRPKTKIDGIECIIKNDQFFKHVDKAVEGNGILSTAAKIISSETLESVALQIAKLHKPIRFDWQAKFGLTTIEPPAEPAKAEKPNHVPPPVSVKPSAPIPAAPAPVASSSETPVCRSCGSDKISVQYGKFGYYFKCSACDGNTPIKLGCGVDGHKERIRKEGKKFFRECAEMQDRTGYANRLHASTETRYSPSHTRNRFGYLPFRYSPRACSVSFQGSPLIFVISEFQMRSNASVAS
jgi:hypothetical protein